VIEHFPTMSRAIQVGLSVVSVATVLRALPKIFQWVSRRYKKSREHRVLRTFYSLDDGPWQSAHGVVGELGLRAAFSDAPGFFPPKGAPNLTGWRLRIHMLKVAPYRWRHSFRRAFIIPSKDAVDKILFDLWERGLLIRAGWDHTRNEYYRLKN
jgi:hypothetical protein